jgi:hypothetical protein
MSGPSLDIEAIRSGAAIHHHRARRGLRRAGAGSRPIKALLDSGRLADVIAPNDPSAPQRPRALL